jgi:hypothetical protein
MQALFYGRAPPAGALLILLLSAIVLQLQLLGISIKLLFYASRPHDSGQHTEAGHVVPDRGLSTSDVT